MKTEIYELDDIPSLFSFDEKTRIRFNHEKQWYSFEKQDGDLYLFRKHTRWGNYYAVVTAKVVEQTRDIFNTVYHKAYYSDGQFWNDTSLNEVIIRTEYDEKIYRIQIQKPSRKRKVSNE